MEVAENATAEKCPGRDSNSPRRAQGSGAHDEIPRASLKSTGTEGPRPDSDRSKSTTARRLIPFRGGMRIEG